MYAWENDRNQALRNWAKGIYPIEAGVELLIRSGWAERLDESGRLRTSDDKKYAEPRVGEYVTGSGYLSGGERRQLVTIASFLGQLARDGDPMEAGNVGPYDLQLYEALPGVDHSFIRLVMSAVGHAAGMHENGGLPLPWPGEDAHWKPELVR